MTSRYSSVRFHASQFSCSLALALTALSCSPAWGAEAIIAAASNFSEPLEALTEAFEYRTTHAIQVRIASTGKLYNQIKVGAPFDVLLAADEATPARLEAEGDTVADTRRTYAIGRLTLWSSDPALLSGSPPSILESTQVRHVAIANPDLAPYGAAARQTLLKLGLWPSVAPKLVMAQNVSEAFLMVATGNAQAGFVALASVTSPRNENPGSRWDVPEQYHDPIRQDGVLLRHGEQNPAAAAFLEFLRSSEARSIIAGYGYSLP